MVSRSGSLTTTPITEGRAGRQTQAALIYYSPSTNPGEQGTIWEVSALGGPPRRVAAALSGGDISHDGRRIVLFRDHEGQTDLAVVARDGSGLQVLKQLPGADVYDWPRWSPDDRTIAYQRLNSINVDTRVYVVPAAGGKPHEVTRGDNLRGIAWLPDSSGLVYSSSVGSTMLDPPIFNLRRVARDGTREQQLTFGDVSFVEPDVHASGKLLATRTNDSIECLEVPGHRISHRKRARRSPDYATDGSNPDANRESR